MATNRTWLRSPEAAAYMGLKPTTFRRLVEAGEIPYTRLGPQSHYLFNPDELDKAVRLTGAGAAFLAGMAAALRALTWTSRRIEP